MNFCFNTIMAVNILQREYEKILQDLMSKDPAELRKELAFWYWAFQKINPETVYLIRNLGQFFRVIKRNYTEIFGILEGIDFEVKNFSLICDVKNKAWDTGEIIHEKKVVTIPKGAVLFYEVVTEQNIEPPPTQQQQY